LFLWLLVPGFALGIGKSGMITVAMIILVAAWQVVILLAYRLGRCPGATRGALIAPAILGLNIEFVKVTLSGFEVSLATTMPSSSFRSRSSLPRNDGGEIW
jgi:hypothetical protein